MDLLSTVMLNVEDFDESIDISVSTSLLSETNEVMLGQLSNESVAHLYLKYTKEAALYSETDNMIGTLQAGVMMEYLSQEVLIRGLKNPAQLLKDKDYRRYSEQQASDKYDANLKECNEKLAK